MKITNYYKEKEYVHYSNCHEDAQFVLDNVKVKPKKILSIASALDNCLTYLLLDPEEIVAIDYNGAQICLCQLKKCAIKHLGYQDFLVFLGVKQGDSLKLYNQIKGFLDEQTCAYFDERIYLISDIKIVNFGRFEYYFNVFKNKILPLVHSLKTVEKFFSFDNLQEQRLFYNKKFNNLRFKLAFKIFFSQPVMKRIGRDKDFFKYNKGNLPAMLKGQFENCVNNNLNKNNPYFQYVALNRFQSDLPYLNEENFNVIKSRVDRIKIKKVQFEEQIKSGEKFDLLYLSDIFEYMSQEKTNELSFYVCNSLNFGGQALFFNMMNTRRLEDCGLIEELIDQRFNRTFYYKAFYSYLKK